MNVWEGVEAAEEARRFKELWAIEGTILVDDEGVAETLGVRGVPTNIFVRPDGVVQEVGAVTPGELEAATRRLLGPEAVIDSPAAAEWHWQQEPEHIDKHITVRSDPRPGGGAG